MEMITVTAAEFQRHFGRYQDEALTQPVAITRNGRERLVTLSAEEKTTAPGLGIGGGQPWCKVA
jgi:PHD/YefM family antitoxin component YafN of YafNO toxin-antitoxin module